MKGKQSWLVMIMQTHNCTLNVLYDLKTVENYKTGVLHVNKKYSFWTMRYVHGKMQLNADCLQKEMFSSGSWCYLRLSKIPWPVFSEVRTAGDLCSSTGPVIGLPRPKTIKVKSTIFCGKQLFKVWNWALGREGDAIYHLFSTTYSSSTDWPVKSQIIICTDFISWYAVQKSNNYLHLLLQLIFPSQTVQISD